MNTQWYSWRAVECFLDALSSAVDWSDLPKEVIHQSLVAKARITTFCKAIHVRQFAKGLRLVAHVPERQVPSTPGDHRTRISLLFRCPVMTEANDSAPESRQCGLPNCQSCCSVSALSLTPESKKCVNKACGRTLVCQSRRESTRREYHDERYMRREASKQGLPSRRTAR